MGDFSFESSVVVHYKEATGHTKIKWEIEFEIRSWGIKSFNVFVPSQTIFVNWQTSEDDEHRPAEFEFKISDVGTVNLDDSLSTPSSLEFDETANKWELQW